jgi:hypothetical protein
MSQYDIIQHTIASTVGGGASFSVNYPTNKGPEDYAGGRAHLIDSRSNRQIAAARGEFSVALGATTFTITLNTNMVYSAGEVIFINLDQAELDPNERIVLADNTRMTQMQVIKIDLGTPTATAANNVVLSQNCTAATGLATGINGALAAAGVATLDVPRNVVAAWTNTAVVTITGTDQYGRVLRQSSASGTSLASTKAFRTITGVSTSADITGLTVGTGKVLGLPVFLGAAADVISEYQDGAVPTAGTTVAGATATATALTGDVRGTYAPNGTPNGALRFEVLVAVRSTDYLGVTQF